MRLKSKEWQPSPENLPKINFAIRYAVLERLNNIIVEGDSQIVVYASLNPSMSLDWQI
jgi:hypothetical protein